VSGLAVPTLVHATPVWQPTFWVGATKVLGAMPEELCAAVEAALKP